MPEFQRIIKLTGAAEGAELRDRPGELFGFYRDGRLIRYLNEFEDEFVRSAYLAGQQLPGGTT